MQGAHSTNDLYKKIDQKSGQAMAWPAPTALLPNSDMKCVSPREYSTDTVYPPTRGWGWQHSTIHALVGASWLHYSLQMEGLFLCTAFGALPGLIESGQPDSVNLESLSLTHWLTQKPGLALRGAVRHHTTADKDKMRALDNQHSEGRKDFICCIGGWGRATRAICAHVWYKHYPVL